MSILHSMYCTAMWEIRKFQLAVFLNCIVCFNPKTSKYHNILHGILLVPPGVKVFR